MFNLNIEILSVDCFVEWTWVRKFLLGNIIPLVFGSIFLLRIGLVLFHNKIFLPYCYRPVLKRIGFSMPAKINIRVPPHQPDEPQKEEDFWHISPAPAAAEMSAATAHEHKQQQGETAALSQSVADAPIPGDGASSAPAPAPVIVAGGSSGDDGGLFSSAPAAGHGAGGTAIDLTISPGSSSIEDEILETPSRPPSGSTRLAPLQRTSGMGDSNTMSSRGLDHGGAPGPVTESVLVERDDEAAAREQGPVLLQTTSTPHGQAGQHQQWGVVRRAVDEQMAHRMSTRRRLASFVEVAAAPIVRRTSRLLVGQ